MKKKLIVLSGFVLSLAPVVAFAQGPTPTTTTSAAAVCKTGELGGILCKVSQLIAGVLPVLIALAVLYFVWGIISFVIADEEEAKTKGRDRIIYGVIGLAVIIGMWGLVAIFNTTFGVGAGTIVPPGIFDLTNVKTGE